MPQMSTRPVDDTLLIEAATDNTTQIGEVT